MYLNGEMILLLILQNRSLQCDYKNVLEGLLISHGHNQEVGRGGTGGVGGQGGPALSEHGHGQQVHRTKSCCVTSTWILGKTQLTSQVLAPHPSSVSSLPPRNLCSWCPQVCQTLLP